MIAGDQKSAARELARALAGVDGVDLAVIRSTWPDAPLDDAADLRSWLSNRPEVAQRVLPLASNGDGPPLHETAAAPTSILDWDVRGAADALKPRPERIYLADGMFRLPSLNVVYGAPGAFKSMLLLDLAVCVAAEKTWLPPRPGGEQVLPVRTVGAPVFWVDLDQGEDYLAERIGALLRGRGLGGDVPLHYVSLPTPWLHGSNLNALGEFATLLRSHEAGLVVIDCLAHALGDAEENLSESGTVMSHFRRLAEAVGAAVVFIHHQRKSSGFNTRAGETLRGHSSIEAALDLALLVNRADGDDAITLKPTKTRGPTVEPLGAVFAYDQRETRGRELATARFFGRPVEDDSRPARARRAIEAALADGPMSKTRLMRAAQSDASNIGLNYLGDTADVMVEEGSLVVETGPHNSLQFDVAP